MELKDQVCSLESAKRLKELGVKQESLFYWVEEDLPIFGYEPKWELYAYRTETKGLRKYYGNCDTAFHHCKSISAFTVAELFEKLPDSINTESLTLDKWRNLYLVCYGDIDDKPFENTLAESAAKLLIECIDNKLIDPV